jgi:hypothetical protein
MNDGLTVMNLLIDRNEFALFFTFIKPPKLVLILFSRVANYLARLSTPGNPQNLPNLAHLRLLISILTESPHLPWISTHAFPT